MAPKYENLQAWQLAHRHVLAIFRETERWPKREWYGLSSQLRRAAVSVVSNLVEGYSKPGKPEYRRYVNIAVGSFGESEYQLRLGHELGFVADDRNAELTEIQAELGRVLHGLSRSLR